MHNNPTSVLYKNLVRSCDRILQDYSWLERQECGKFDDGILALRTTAGQIIDEFEKITVQKKRAVGALKKAQEKNKDVLDRILPQNYRSIENFMEAMGILDRETAEMRALETVKFIDRDALGTELILLEQRVSDLCTHCANF